MTRMLAITVALLALAAAAEADPHHHGKKPHPGKPHPTGADVRAALVRCADVSYPAPLTGCGDDPLQKGRIEILRHGDVLATLTGAEPLTTYDVVLLSTNASASLPIAVLATDALGNAYSRFAGVFDLGQAGIVALTLGRNGSTEFVAGFRGSHELDATLVPCAAIDTPLPLDNCGTDPLKSGLGRIDDGDVKVDINGALPDSVYDVVIRPLGGGSDVVLGAIHTDKKGKGELRRKDVIADDVVGAGNIVLQRDGLDQFITGFQSIRKRPPHPARFHVGLLRCADVTTLAPLTGCGFDQLNRGDVIIDDKGDVNVHVMGAVARATYEVVFVGIDATTEVAVGTFTTNPAGNGHLHARDVFPVGTGGVGHVFIKRDGIDQYVTGFSVSR